MTTPSRLRRLLIGLVTPPPLLPATRAAVLRQKIGERSFTHFREECVAIPLAHVVLVVPVAEPVDEALVRKLEQPSARLAFDAHMSRELQVPFPLHLPFHPCPTPGGRGSTQLGALGHRAARRHKHG